MPFRAAQSIGDSLSLVLEDAGLDAAAAAIGTDANGLAVSWRLRVEDYPLRRTLHCLHCGKTDVELVTLYQAAAPPTGALQFYPVRHELTVLATGSKARIFILEGQPLIPIGLPEDARLAVEWLQAHPDLITSPTTGRPRDSGMLDHIQTDDIGEIYAALWKARPRPGKAEVCHALGGKHPELLSDPSEQTLAKRLRKPPDRLTWEAFCKRYRPKR